MRNQDWLQNPRLPCNSGFRTLAFQGCVPYYFNHGTESRPATLFFDGHVAPIEVREAQRADSQHQVQTGYGLWSRDTPWGENGYYIDFGYDMATTSFHILTTNGIRGRDVVAK